MAQAPNLLTSAEVCTRFNITRGTLSRWVSSGKITPALKMGGIRGAFLFRPADVERLAKRRELRLGRAS